MRAAQRRAHRQVAAPSRDAGPVHAGSGRVVMRSRPAPTRAAQESLPATTCETFGKARSSASTTSSARRRRRTISRSAANGPVWSRLEPQLHRPRRIDIPETPRSGLSALRSRQTGVHHGHGRHPPLQVLAFMAHGAADRPGAARHHARKNKVFRSCNHRPRQRRARAVLGLPRRARRWRRLRRPRRSSRCAATSTTGAWAGVPFFLAPASAWPRAPTSRSRVRRSATARSLPEQAWARPGHDHLTFDLAELGLLSFYVASGLGPGMTPEKLSSRILHADTSWATRRHSGPGIILDAMR